MPIRCRMKPRQISCFDPTSCEVPGCLPLEQWIRNSATYTRTLWPLPSSRKAVSAEPGSRILRPAAPPFCQFLGEPFGQLRGQQSPIFVPSDARDMKNPARAHRDPQQDRVRFDHLRQRLAVKFPQATTRSCGKAAISETPPGSLTLCELMAGCKRKFFCPLLPFRV